MTTASKLGSRVTAEFATTSGSDTLGVPAVPAPVLPPPATDPLDPSANTETFGAGSIIEGRYRYRLERSLGSGGFGSVFLATCLDADPSDPDKPPGEVAVKLLGMNPERTATISLKRELAALRAIRHHRIPTLFDWKLDGDGAFVALEYFAAGSLADARPRMGRFDETQTWRLLSDLLSALAAAHRASVLHLDVKPSNVLLSASGGFVLTDFGVSHSSRMSRGLLHQGQIAIGLGTHGFRAPEQANLAVQSFDLRTDLWGVGATAWSMYTGIDLNKRPDVLRRAEDGNIYGLRRLSDVHLSCPPQLEEVIMSLLFIDPARRPGGAAEVLDQIHTITQGAGLVARPVALPPETASLSREIQQLLDGLVDPLWSSICRTPGFERFFARFEPGTVLASSEIRAHHSLLVLRGTVQVEKDGEAVDVEEPEGELLGAISTLTGAPRTVTLRAADEVWACVFNEAELEQLVTCNPSVAVRMIRSMASRIASGPPRHRD